MVIPFVYPVFIGLFIVFRLFLVFLLLFLFLCAIQLTKKRNNEEYSLCIGVCICYLPFSLFIKE
ncbi:hypothetical protein Bache_1774 [Bacteroides helcogenes P 36-108]|uniref:Uncharacterized protein n=1 Tax=Bacteroides helcogenes (strain ATCC 35417 / DSM 20613 / JCM 6297 / CCUG 15421 / P 36-108) TaxID=693979 RepID=E6SNL0_BACT6|nr:hypothetical protein Bache_1774 [Bacteroides helcogenes P 36-108]